MSEESQASKNIQSTKKTLAQIGYVGIATCLVVAAFYIVNFSGGLSHSQEKWAQFGDYFGGVAGPILSLFALIALLITIVLQLEQLQLSRQELEATRNELKRSAEAQEKAQKHLESQANSAELSAYSTVLLRLLDVTNDFTDPNKLKTVLNDPKLRQEHEVDAITSAMRTKQELNVELLTLYSILNSRIKNKGPTTETNNS